MGFLTKLEKLSEKYIEGFFKAKFADHVQPAEIAKLLLREMRDSKSISVSRTYVPNEYIVLLGKRDWEILESVRASLSSELQQFLVQKAGDKGYEMVGEAKVDFELDEPLPLGTISVKSRFSEELPRHREEMQRPVDTVPSLPMEDTIFVDKGFFVNQASPTVEDTLTRLTAGELTPKGTLVQKAGTRDGSSFPLGIHGILIGRRRTNDVTLDDSNVSRVHASIDYLGGEYFITDLGSTNGTFVNGTRINKKKLAPGDLIRVGSTILEFRVV